LTIDNAEQNLLQGGRSSLLFFVYASLLMNNRFYLNLQIMLICFTTIPAILILVQVLWQSTARRGTGAFGFQNWSH